MEIILDFHLFFLSSRTVYCGRLESLNLNDKILSPGIRVEPDAISLSACEGERGCQDSKDVGINSNFQADRSKAQRDLESAARARSSRESLKNKTLLTGFSDLWPNL
jgi:hypothetical protein